MSEADRWVNGKMKAIKGDAFRFQFSRLVVREERLTSTRATCSSFALRIRQRSVNFRHRRHAGRMAAAFDAVEGFGGDAGDRAGFSLHKNRSDVRS